MPDDPNVVASTIIDCNESSRGITFSNVDASEINVTISGLTIVNGDSGSEHGGGISIGINTSPIIKNVVM